MNSKTSRFWGTIKRPLFYIPAIVIILIIGLVILASRKKPASNFTTVKADFGTIQEEVNVTGSVVASTTVDLSLERSGKVTSIPKNVGDHVQTGDILLTTSSSDLSAQYESAKASEAQAQARLDALLRGARPEEVQVNNQTVAAAQTNLDSANQSLSDEIRTSITNADNAVRNQADAVFTGPETGDPQLNFFIENGDLSNKVESERMDISSLFQAWETDNQTNATNQSALLSTARINLAKIRSFLDDLSSAVSDAQTGNGNTETEIAADRASIAGARNTISETISTLNTDEQTVTKATAALSTAKAQANLAVTTDPADIDAQQAAVAAARANADSIAAQIAKTVIHSPIAGVVTKVNAKVGEIAGANTPLVSLITDSQYHIEAFVPEADISKVKAGEQADVTLDAYGNDAKFKAQVISVDPAETIIDSVPTYKTTFEFIGSDDRIKSGMTANIDLFGDHKDHVIAIPQRAVSTDSNGTKTVVVENADKTQHDVTVTTGLRGSNGNIEITSGLSGGENVVIEE